MLERKIQTNTEGKRGRERERERKAKREREREQREERKEDKQRRRQSHAFVAWSTPCDKFGKAGVKMKGKSKDRRGGCDIFAIEPASSAGHQQMLVTPPAWLQIPRTSFAQATGVCGPPRWPETFPLAGW